MSEWIKCADKMPDCDELRERPNKAKFWVHFYNELTKRPCIVMAYRIYKHGKWKWVNHIEIRIQLVIPDEAITHYMPIIQPAPPQD